MANRDTLYGLDLDVKTNLDKKRSPEQEKQIMEWIEQVTGEKIANKSDIQGSLKDGQLLCKLVNKISPGKIKTFNTTKGAFQMMENIQSFYKAAKEMGVSDFDLFATVDLYEGRNLGKVMQSIEALARVSAKSGFKGPQLVGAAKLADKNMVPKHEVKDNNTVPLLSKLVAENKIESEKRITNEIYKLKK